MPLSTTTFDSIIIIKLIKMARNDYNFGMEDVAEDVQSPQEKVASSVENKDNSNVDNSYERKRLESNLALLKEVEELARSINEKYNEINAMYETAIGNERDRLQGLKNILEQCKSMYSNISSYIDSNDFLGIKDSSREDGAALQIASGSNTPGQAFFVTNNGDGTYNILM